ncbi:hypothetical protein PRIPAC_80330 [Pristionchus pacificus]|uniref:Uncharacterized protein n=1 Tax=Pristionchus pacificus TaxID=54126 RepID=A0A2A6BXI7_PRIPA|nr:hypothetical protein PRIPAC_80330 [Pristionchus pacificus]|eukprot:PDM70598.1 hypothetical protein PRIPAC_46844 [Pristionchus pacificus]
MNSPPPLVKPMRRRMARNARASANLKSPKKSSGRRRRGVSPKTWCIAEDVVYRRRRGVSPKTWRIAEDVAYRRRRGVSPKTWCIAEDVIN